METVHLGQIDSVVTDGVPGRAHSIKGLRMTLYTRVAGQSSASKMARAWTILLLSGTC